MPGTSSQREETRLFFTMDSLENKRKQNMNMNNK